MTKAMNYVKRLFATVLCAILVMTSFTLAGFVPSYDAQAATINNITWNEIASSDFTKPGVSGSTGDQTYTDNGMTWKFINYNGSGNTVFNSNGAYIPDGYMYLSDWNNKSDSKPTPMTGKEAFKIDLQFQFTANDSVTGKNNNYAFMVIGTDTSKKLDKQNASMWKNMFASVAGDGRMYLAGDSTEVNKYGNYIRARSTMTTNTTYHYIFDYAYGYSRAYIVDADGEVVRAICGYKKALDTNSIMNLAFGDDDMNYYYKYIRYQNIKFYDATPNQNAMTKVQRAGDKNHFLFAYFTGQADRSSGKEEISLAVSKDGKNFEPLNCNDKILSNVPTSSYWSHQGVDMSKVDGNGKVVDLANAIEASNAARDPFIIQKRDASGSPTDGYYIIATDLAVSSTGNYDNTKFLVWDVDSITNVDTADCWNVETVGWYGEGAMPSTSQIAWAPEIAYDEQNNIYMVYYSGYVYSSARIRYVYTNDFKTYYQDAACTKEIGKTYHPKTLLDPGFQSIDGNITYDGKLYHMFLKEESNQKSNNIWHCTAENLSGPYSDCVTFTNGIACEGPEVYQLNDNSYVLMMDKYQNDTATFVTYTNNDLDNFTSSNFTNEININHLSPRHGAVSYITEREYESLIEKYGVASAFESNAARIKAEGNFNDHLIARYFTNMSDITDDATGHGYTLTNHSATMENYQSKTAVHIDGTDYLEVSTGSNGTIGKKLGSTITANDEFTLDWWGYPDNGAESDYSRFVEISPYARRSITYPGDNATHDNSGYANHFFYVAASGVFGADGHLNKGIAGKYRQNWTRYTVSVSKNYVNLYINGNLIRTVYNSNGTKAQDGSPWYETQIDDGFFNEIFGSTSFIRFGEPIFNGDSSFTGYISDFRIYDRAMTPDGLTISDKEIRDALLGDTSGAKQVFGNVEIDPIIFTHGTYNGTVHGNLAGGKEQFDYMTKGKYIADGTTYDNGADLQPEYKTEFKLKSDSSYSKIVSVEFVEPGCTAKNEENIAKDTPTILKGELDAYKDIDDGYVTVKFLFEGGDYELHRVAVKTHPVATHTLATLFAWCQPFGTFRYPTTFKVVAVGSYGQTTNDGGQTNSYSMSSTSNHNGTTQEVMQNFQGMYSYNREFDSWEDDQTVKMDTMTQENGSFAKTTGYYVGYTYKERAQKEMTVNSLTATYYIDKSSNKNYGVTYSTSNPNSFTIKMFAGSNYWSPSGLNAPSNNTAAQYINKIEYDLNNTGSSTFNAPTLDSAISSQMNIKSDTHGYATITGKPVAGATTTAIYSLGYRNKSGDSCQGSLKINTKVNLVVSDKTSARNTYNECINHIKDCREACYTPDSWSNYVEKLLILEEYLNDNTDTNEGTRVSDVTAARNGLQPKADEFIHNLVKDSTVDATCTESSTDTYSCSYNCGFTVTKHDTLPLGHLSENVSFVDNGDGTHNVMCNRYATPHLKEGPLPCKLVDSGVAATCTTAGYTEQTCSVCGHKTAQTPIAALGHNYLQTADVDNGDGSHTYTYTCSRCGDHFDSTIDMTAYLAAVKVAEYEAQQTNKYTSDSIAYLETVLSNNTIEIGPSTTQAEIDTATDNIIAATEALVLVKVSVTFIAILDGEDQAPLVYNNVDYGTMLEFTVPSGYHVTNWTRQTGSDPVVSIKATSNTVTYFATKTCVYKAKANSTEKDSEATNPSITMLNISNKPVDIEYLPAGTYSTSYADGVLKIGSVELDVQGAPFYEITGFEADGVEFNGSLAIAGDTVIKPIYSATKENQFTITAQNCTITSGSTAYNNVYHAKWDEKVTITKDGANANTVWYANNRIVAYGESYTFRVSTSTTITTSESTAEKLPVSSVNFLTYGGYREKTITAVGTYLLPEGYNKVAAGVQLKTSKTSLDVVSDPANFIDGVGVLEAKTFTDTNQYTINAFATYNYTTLYVGARAYIDYTVGDSSEVHRVYSDVVTFSYSK